MMSFCNEDTVFSARWEPIFLNIISIRFRLPRLGIPADGRQAGYLFAYEIKQF
jgi:hypothetical protein